MADGRALAGSLNQHERADALECLRADHRRVVSLRFLHGHNMAEVAQIMRKSADVVKKLQARRGTGAPGRLTINQPTSKMSRHMGVRQFGRYPAVRAVVDGAARETSMGHLSTGGQATRLLIWLLAMVSILPGVVAFAQVQQGATLTVLRGQVAVIHPDGSAIQPAPSGSTVDVGDEIRTISKSGALITFFSGTEIEMSDDTILVVDQLSRQGDKIDISLRQVLGATVNRVQSLTGTGSSFEIQAGGAVAVVRGTSFALVGPVTTSVGNVVTTTCQADCSPASTFAGCPMLPYTGLGVVTGGGKVEHECTNFPVDRTANLVDAGVEGVTTTEQYFQGPTQGISAGIVAPGNRKENNAPKESREIPVPTPSPSPLPPVGATPCNTQIAGGPGVTTTVHDLVRTSGTFNFQYEAFVEPDRFQMIYEGRTLLDTGLVPRPGVPSGDTVSLTYSGASRAVTVIVTGPATGTVWNYTVGCPV